jgi:O-antigen ligase
MPHSFRRGLLIALCLIVLLTDVVAAWRVVSDHQTRTRGVTFDLPPDLPLAINSSFGVNASLEQCDEAGLRQALDLIRDGGFHWVRQHFPWADIEPECGRFNWQRWDSIVAMARQHDLRLIAVLDTSPTWARRPGNESNRFAPPQEVSDYGAFVAAFARRYQASIDHYEIWDEPNIAPHWGNSIIDPGDYVRLLREGYLQIKSADPTASVLTAGLAPNIESGPINLSDVAFLQAIYEAGAQGYFDIVAAKPYGFTTGPDDRRASAAITNFSRLSLLRDVMVRHGDGPKPIWAVEFGWSTSANLDEVTQARWTTEAIDRARREWPWLGAMVLSHLQPVPSDDSRRGYALIGPDGSPHPVYQAVKQLATAPLIAYPGRYAPDHPAARYEGAWRVTPQAADIGKSGDALTIPFDGTRLDLIVQRGSFWAVLYATVDGKPANILPRDSQGRAYLVLYDPLHAPATVPIARGLSSGPHEARFVAEGGWGQWAILGWQVSREEDAAPYAAALAGLSIVGFAALATLAILARPLPWRVWGEVTANRYRALDDRAQLGLILIAAAIFYFAPWLPISLIGLALLFVLIYLRLDLGLVLLVFTVPFFLYPKEMLGKRFSMVEVITLLSLLAAAGLWVAQIARCKSGITYRISHIALPSALRNPPSAIIFFLAVSILSLLAAENLEVASRELRVVVIEPVLFYFLLRVVPLDRRRMFWLAGALIAAALVVSLIGLYQYFFTADVITAEGVRRIRGVYGSPNNLSLFLGRIIPIIAALWLGSRSARGRIGYAAIAAPILVCFYFTYSRGAWLVGVPAALVFIGLAWGGRARWATLAAAAAAVLGLVPLLGTERFTSLLNTQAGTSFFRIKLWQGAIQMIRDHPILGVGLDNFLYQYRTRYVLPEAWQELNLSHPHNLVLDFWARLGILGVAALVWLEVAFFATGRRVYRRLVDPEQRALAIGLMASMVDFLAHGLIDNSYFLVDLAFVFFLTVGLMEQLERVDCKASDFA